MPALSRADRFSHSLARGQTGRPFKHGPFVFTAFATEHLHSLAGYFRRSYPNTCFDCYGVTIEHKASATSIPPIWLIPAS